jgi:hypothetical protein
MSSPTQRTLKLLRDHGWDPWVVEYWNPHAKKRVDMFGILDVVALYGLNTLGLQACSACDVAKRQDKIMASPWTYKLILAGWRLQVIGWRLPTKTRRTYTPLIRELTPDGWITLDSPTAERPGDPAPGAAPVPGPQGCSAT